MRQINAAASQERVDARVPADIMTKTGPSRLTQHAAAVAPTVIVTL
jgi:hypothetical protein